MLSQSLTVITDFSLSVAWRAQSFYKLEKARGISFTLGISTSLFSGLLNRRQCCLRRLHSTNVPSISSVQPKVETLLLYIEARTSEELRLMKWRGCGYIRTIDTRVPSQPSAFALLNVDVRKERKSLKS